MPHDVDATESPAAPTKDEWPPESAFRTTACPACFGNLWMDCPECDGMGAVIVCGTVTLPILAAGWRWPRNPTPEQVAAELALVEGLHDDEI